MEASKTMYVVLAYPVSDPKLPAKIWGSNKVASNSVKEGWMNVDDKAHNGVAVKLMPMADASAIREKSQQYAPRGSDDYRYLIVPARAWEGVL